MDARPGSSTLGVVLRKLSVLFAYAGGAIIAVIGIMSAISIIGRTVASRSILGDFELVEIGTAVAGTLFLSYCQAAGGNIFVDIFTLRLGDRTRDWLDRFGCFVMALMFFVVGWRAIAGGIDIKRAGETSMLMGFPIWIGYFGMLPGVFLAGVTALAQSFGINVSEPAVNE